jgi:4-amino-4-deoxy-L-arabinose transferase-like glycosyltransferase
LSSPPETFPVTSAAAHRGWWLILLLAAVVWCANLEYRKLSLSDEGRYSEIPRYMAESGDWITPRLNGIKYFEKPPLQYWTTAAAYKLFGEHNWTARLWPALTGFLGILAVFYTGRRLFGTRPGMYSALVLGSSLLYVGVGHFLSLDMGLTFFLTVALAGILIALEPSADARTNRIAMHVATAACALAVLSKGLIGVILPGLVIALYVLVRRDFALLRRLHLVSAGALFLAICAPWFIAVSIANPEFPHFFFIREHFQRYTSTIHGRYQPWYFFIPIMLAGMVPWVITLFHALFEAARRKRSAAFDPTLFLLLWAGGIFVFFSASGSKLLSYVLPIIPALALLMGAHLTTIRGRTLAVQLLPIAVLSVAGALAAPHAVKLATISRTVDMMQRQVPWLEAAAISMLVCSVLAIYCALRNRVEHAVIACATGGLLMTQLLMTSGDALSPSQSTYHLVQKARPYLKPDVPFYSVGTYEQTLPFHIKRTVTLVAYQDEMAFGLQHEPSLWVPDLGTFERLWRSHAYALAVMGLDMYEQLQRERLPMQLIAGDTKRVIVRTEPR